MSSPTIQVTRPRHIMDTTLAASRPSILDGVDVSQIIRWEAALKGFSLSLAWGWSLVSPGKCPGAARCHDPPPLVTNVDWAAPDTRHQAAGPVSTATQATQGPVSSSCLRISDNGKYLHGGGGAEMYINSILLWIISFETHSVILKGNKCHLAFMLLKRFVLSSLLFTRELKATTKTKER